MFDPSKAEHVYIAIGYTNLRMGIDGLSSLVANRFHENPQTNSLFLFCGRKRDRIKGLYWDRDGYILQELTSQQFRWLMEGLNIYQEKAIQPVTKQFRY